MIQKKKWKPHLQSWWNINMQMRASQSDVHKKQRITIIHLKGISASCLSRNLSMGTSSTGQKEGKTEREREIKHRHPFVIIRCYTEIPKTKKPLTTIFYTRQISGGAFILFVFLAFRWWGPRECHYLQLIRNGEISCCVHDAFDHEASAREEVDYSPWHQQKKRSKRARAIFSGKAARATNNTKNTSRHMHAPLPELREKFPPRLSPQRRAKPLGKQMIMNGISLMQHWRATVRESVAFLNHLFIYFNFHVVLCCFG